MTFKRRSRIDLQFTVAEKIAMYRSTWELDLYVRQHIADLVDERRSCSPIIQSVGGLASPLTQLRHRLGIGLIKAGEALAGCDVARGLPTSPAGPAMWE